MLVTQRTRALKKAFVVLLLGAVFVLSGTHSAQAQARYSDQAQILQQVVDLSGLQDHYPTAGKTAKPLVVMQHAVSFPSDLKVLHGGSPLVFMSKEQLKAATQDAYFYFNEFQVDGNKARVDFTYYYDQASSTPKMQVVYLQLEKSEKGWFIVQSKIDAR